MLSRLARFCARRRRADAPARLIASGKDWSAPPILRRLHDRIELWEHVQSPRLPGARPTGEVAASAAGR